MPGITDVGGKLVRRSAVVVVVGVEGRESGSGIAEGVPGRTISTGGCRGALGGRTGGIDFPITGPEDSPGEVVSSGEGSASCG